MESINVFADIQIEPGIILTWESKREETGDSYDLRAT